MTFNATLTRRSALLYQSFMYDWATVQGKQNYVTLFQKNSFAYRRQELSYLQRQKLSEVCNLQHFMILVRIFLKSVKKSCMNDIFGKIKFKIELTTSYITFLESQTCRNFHCIDSIYLPIRVLECS